MKLSIARLFARLRKNEDGTQLVETAIWLGIISAVVVGAVVTMAPIVQRIFAAVAADMSLLP